MFGYRQLFKKSFQIVWHNRFLWVFGFFASFLGVSGGYEIVFANLDKMTSESNIWLSLKSIFILISSPQFFLHLKQKLFSEPSSFIFLFFIYLIFAGLVLLLLWLIINSSIGSIYCPAKIFGEKKTNLAEGWRRGKKNFWSILGVYILAVLLAGLVSLIFSWPIYSFSFGNLGFVSKLLFLLIYAVYTLILFAVSAAVIYSSAFIVLKNSKFFPALKQGFLFFFRNFLVSLEMIFLMAFIAVISGLLLAIFLFLLGIPLFISLFISYILKFVFGIQLLVVISLLLFLLGVILFVSILTAFQQTAWVILFLNLLDGGFIGKLARMRKKA